jgi:hypothetical protein
MTRPSKLAGGVSRRHRQDHDQNDLVVQVQRIGQIAKFRGMAGAGHRKAGRPADLLGDRHRDRLCATRCVSSATAPDRGVTAIDR